MKVDHINSYIMNMQPKVGAISFNKKVTNKFLRNQLVLGESLIFWHNKDSHVVYTGATWVIEFLRNHLVFKENSSLQLSNNDSYIEDQKSLFLY